MFTNTICYQTPHGKYAKESSSRANVLKIFHSFVILYVRFYYLRLGQHFFSHVGTSLPGLTSTKQQIKCLAQAHNTITLPAVSRQIGMSVVLTMEFSRQYLFLLEIQALLLINIGQPPNVISFLCSLVSKFILTPVCNLSQLSQEMFYYCISEKLRLR